MTNEGSENKIVEKDEEKILYSDNKTVCFACGEQISKDTKVCPYCQTTIK